MVRVRKSRFADTARRWGVCPEGGVVFLRLSSDQWTHGARCLVVREAVAKLVGWACCAADRGRAPAEWESR